MGSGPYFTDNLVLFFKPQYLIIIQCLLRLALCAVLSAVLSVAALGEAVLGDAAIFGLAVPGYVVVLGMTVLGMVVLGDVLYLVM